MLKIYLVSRTDEWNYDEYDAMVVIAKNKKDAKSFLSEYPTTVECIGTAKTNQKEEIILASFNAG